ncbi:5'-methylthioadenosine/adenosylhomocysteine nucleosidase [Acidovorax sp. GBBC 3334]|uniref:5'-methylthioadenosine/adenosylhomocysteine nucleosidase n=1 Tax=Acidovorax sp. GBBC 3334 TaxID=2940496 RepID=UPI002304CA19|nr:5'-methylthioadenosine/adenosylhomocysteine nucleosidase [Acidovorax sp. GBBC 3334]MDA8456474.1 5'-methylthioadenosine/adenosylhomocysteine nucleosidase [Acidovorax sp. GBBC 3334]
MPTIAILSALPDEQAGLSAALQSATRIAHAGRTFQRGTLHGRDAVLALSGIGKVAAATTAAALIERFGADRIVFTGVAGGLGEGVRIGDVVVAQEMLQHDMDASPLFPRWEVPGYGRVRMACDPALTGRLLEAAHECLAAGAGDPVTQERAVRAAAVHAGLVASGDRFVSGAAEADALARTLRAAGHDVLAVEMEGAAVAQVCADHGVPFAAVRTISDRADDDAPRDFAHFVRTVAGRYADGIVGRLLQKL